MKRQPIAAAIAALGLAMAASSISAQTAPATGAAATGGAAGTAGAAPAPMREQGAATPPATSARPAATPGATATATTPAPATTATTTTTTTSPAAGTAGADRPTTAGAPTGAATGATTGTPMGEAPAAAPRATTGPAAAGPQTDRQARADWERRHRASKMIGTNVRDQQGDRVGSIEDFVLDQQGRVAYAVISAGGFLGMGENLYAVPWNTLNIQPGQDHYVMNVDKERMKSAHGFDKDNWPDMSDAKWQATTQGAWTMTQPAATTPAAGRPQTATTVTTPATSQQTMPAATMPAPGQQQQQPAGQAPATR